MSNRPRAYRSARTGRLWLRSLRHLARTSLTDAQVAERLGSLGYGTWTPRQVRYHRRRTAQLPAKPVPPAPMSFPCLVASRWLSTRVAVAHRGWGHLFTPCPFGSRPHVEQLSLTECGILDNLQDVGPCSQSASYPLRRLIEAGLVVKNMTVRSVEGQRRPVCSLAPGVRRKVPNARPLSADLLISRLFGAAA